MKQAFMKERGKREVEAENFQLHLRRDIEEKILQLRSLLAAKDTTSSHSDSSSLEDHEPE